MDNTSPHSPHDTNSYHSGDDVTNDDVTNDDVTNDDVTNDDVTNDNISCDDILNYLSDDFTDPGSHSFIQIM